MELDASTENIMKVIVMISNKEFKNEIFKSYDVKVFENTLTMKHLKDFCINKKIISYRGFDISLRILKGLELINIYKISTTLGIQLTEVGINYAIKNYGGNENE